jgi:hypothetical protein
MGLFGNVSVRCWWVLCKIPDLSCYHFYYWRLDNWCFSSLIFFDMEAILLKISSNSTNNQICSWWFAKFFVPPNWFRCYCSGNDQYECDLWWAWRHLLVSNMLFLWHLMFLARVFAPCVHFMMESIYTTLCSFKMWQEARMFALMLYS